MVRGWCDARLFKGRKTVAGQSAQEGLKVHQDADKALIAATKRLHEKDLITQPDGGYLTSLGRDAVEHVQTLLTILTTKPLVAVKLAELA